MQHRFLFVLALCAAARRAAAAERERVEGVRQAVAANPRVRNAAIDTAKLAERRASAQTQLYPDARIFALAAQPLAPVNFTVLKGTLGFDSGGQALPAGDATIHNGAGPIGIVAVSVTEPLSLIPSIKRSVHIVDLQKEMAEEQSRLERQQVVRDVRQLYYGIQTAQSALKAAQEDVRLSQEVVRVTSEYVAKRQVLDVDYLEAQMRLARFNENVLDLEDQRETLKAKLNQKMGRDLLTEFDVSAIPEPGGGADNTAPDESLAAARAAAVEHRPEVRQARLKVEQAKLELSNAGAAFNPTIVAQYLGLELLDVTPLLPRTIGLAGVGLTWEPFTWGRRKHELAGRRDEIDEAMNLEQETEQQVRVEVAEQFRRVGLSAAKLRVASLTRQMAAESLRISQTQYAAQYSLLKTVLEAQASLENADADYRRTVTDLWTARAELDRAMGVDR